MNTEHARRALHSITTIGQLADFINTDESVIDGHCLVDLFACSMDDQVHDCKGAEAAAINNDGPERQARYLVESGWDASALANMLANRNLPEPEPEPPADLIDTLLAVAAPGTTAETADRTVHVKVEGERWERRTRDGGIPVPPNAVNADDLAMLGVVAINGTAVTS